MSVLVTGGAGYIGSVVVDSLIARGEKVVVLDDLSGGHIDAINDAAVFCNGSIGDVDLVESLVADHQVEACIHFAGLIAVGESVREPRRYIDVNVGQSLALLGALIDANVSTFVFSSSAAVYGDPDTVPIPENHRLAPTSPYGATKMMVEQVLGHYEDAGLLTSAKLRYFNAAGATESRSEKHDPETHLIPLAVEAAVGRRDPLVVYGTDYPTPDGTAIRDYVHVADLARAHVLALDHLRGGGDPLAANLGNGTGYSVQDVLLAVERCLGRPVPSTNGPRRPGDPAVLVAAPGAAHEVLGWKPESTSLDDIVASVGSLLS